VLSLGICSVILAGLSLNLISADSLVKAAHPSGNPDLIPPLDRETPELSATHISHIRIDPPFPTENDVIRITAFGNWFNICVPRYQSHQIVGNVIRITATASFFGVCVPIEGPTSWSFTIEVGPLPIGLYIVEVYFLDPSFWGRPPILYDTTSFLVPKVRLYLPVIRRNY
jgi:hypothetical protein